MEYLLMFLMAVSGIFLILLVLIQRGRGGGLAGAFGGAGGQSAFGTKAGDVFTRVTIGVAAFWIILCAISVKILSTSSSKFDSSLGGAAAEREQPGATGGKTEEVTPAGKPSPPSGESATPAESSSAPANDSAAPASDTAAPASTPANDGNQ